MCLCIATRSLVSPAFCFRLISAREFPFQVWNDATVHMCHMCITNVTWFFSRSQLETYFVTFDYVNIIKINNQAICTCNYSIVGFFYRNKASLYDIKITPLTSTLEMSFIMTVHIHDLIYFQCTKFMLPRPEHQLLLAIPIQLSSSQSLTASQGQWQQTRQHGLVGTTDDISFSLPNT